MVSLSERCPKIYTVNRFPNYWVAEATDGYLYKVPNKAGAWVQRDVLHCEPFDGPEEELRPLPSDKARSIMWFVYGDIGSTVIAEG